jgi:solute carrier family 45 protein 1/2/4
MMKDIWINIRILPPNIRQICLIQFFSWIGWFPVLFFTTVWVGEIYTLSLTDAEIAEIIKGGKNMTEEATLIGFIALLWSSLLGLVTIILLPLVVSFFQRRQRRRQMNTYNPHSYLGSLHLTIADIWTFSLALFGICMFATAFTTDSVDASINIIALTGFCFAVSMWVPFSLLGEEISGAANKESNTAAYQAIPAEGEAEEGDEDHESIPLHQQSSARRGSAEHEDRSAGPVVFDADPEGRRPDVDERTLVDGDDREHPISDREEQSALMKDLERSELGVEDVGGSSRVGRHDADMETGRAAGRRQKKGLNIADKAGIILVSVFLRHFSTLY